MPLGLIAVSLLGVFEVLLALIIFLHDSKSLVNRIFSLFILSIVLWTISNYLADYFSSLFWTNTTYLGAVFIFYTLLLFTEAFPDRTISIPNILNKILLIVTLLFAFLIFVPGLIVEKLNLYSGGVDVVTGPLFPFLAIYFIGLLFGSLWLLFKKYRRSSGIEKIQLQYISFGLFISFLLGVVANLLLPYLTGNYLSSQYGPYGVVFFLVITTFAIVRYNLLNITVIATEVFVVFLILILLAQAIVADTPIAVGTSFAVLTLACVLSYFLIRSMLREVKQKEELEKLSKLLEQTNEELKHLDETKSEFVSIASHQLRTPLTVIKGYLSMIEEGSFGKIPEKEKGPLDKVYESANRLIDLVENLLSVSRIESGRMKYNLGLTQLADMAASVVDEIMTKAKEKKLHLQYDAPREPLPQINIDSDKIRQVMMNIVDNAVKYTKKGSVHVIVRLDQGAAGTHVTVPSIVFEVRDTGNGVRADDKDRLFQKFIRGQGSSLVHTEGTGLGLYVGRMMVEAHGGNIWVDSKGEGLGSTFGFSLPVTIPKNAPALAASATKPVEQPAPAPAPSAT